LRHGANILDLIQQSVNRRISNAASRAVTPTSTLHELFHVYVDDEAALRTEHTISFLGLTIIRLHYKMSPASSGASNTAPSPAPGALALGQTL